MISASMVKELREMSGAGMLDCKKALEATEGNMEAAVDWLREKGISKAAKKADRIAAEGVAAILVEGNKAVAIEVNSETDFVAKNEEFQGMVQTILTLLMSSEVESGNIEAALALPCEDATLNDLIISKTATIGEKLTLRRFVKLTKEDNESFGSYIHMGGRIAVLTQVKDASEEVAKEVAMHAAAMRPKYVSEAEVPEAEIEKEKEIAREQLLNEGKPADRIDAILVGKIKKYYEEVCLLNQPFIKAENKETVQKYIEQNGGTLTTMIRFEVGEGIQKKEENFAEEVAKQIAGN